MFFADQFVDGLARLSLPRRQACVFALETKAVPEDVIDLTWARAAAMNQLSLPAVEVLRVASLTRHIRLNYVFWEWATDKIATPLLRLRWSVETAFDCTWQALLQKHMEMVTIDRRADVSNFRQIVQEVADGRL